MWVKALGLCFSCQLLLQFRGALQNIQANITYYGYVPESCGLRYSNFRVGFICLSN